MAPSHRCYDIDEDDEVFEGSGAQSPLDSCMTSGQMTPAGPVKKKVGWSLGSPSSDGGDDAEARQQELLRQVTLELEPYQDSESLQAPAPIRRPQRGLLRRSGSTTPQHELEVVDEDIPDFATKRQSATDAYTKASQLTDDLSRPSSPAPARPENHRRHTSFRKHMFHPNRAGSGMTTPEENVFDADYIEEPEHWRTAGLSAKLLGITRGRHSRHNSGTYDSAPSTPGRSPQNSVLDLVGSSSAAASVGSRDVAGLARSRRPGLPRSASEDTLVEKFGRSSLIRSANSSLLDLRKLMKSPAGVDPVIKDHVEETGKRQKFLIKLCRALMLYGAPTHRIEEYMKATARVLETEAQFLYIPGCMIVSFDDSQTHTTEVKLVRVQQEVDLGRLRDTHDIYKEVIHDHVGAQEATERLEEIMARKPRHNIWYRVGMYGIASVCVGPFAFGARLIDLPMAFILGLIVGFLQLVVAPTSDLYANIFEIAAVLMTSFLARWWGTYRHSQLFCFPALAQSAIALILPGYTVLCGALELQAKSIIAGSVRLVYAIIYSLFLGFALTMGTAIYGAIDANATSDTTCRNPLSEKGYWIFIFVPPFTFSLMVINQAKYKQMPVMLIIAFGGYLVNFFTAKRFAGNAQVSSALGSFAIAAMANLYSRVSLDEAIKRVTTRARKLLSFNPSEKKSQPIDVENGESEKQKKKPRVNYSLAAAAMLPAIFVQVPSGLSVSGSLVQGISTSDEIVKNGTGTTLTPGQVTTGQVNVGNASSSIAFTVGFSVVQVAIGITVGLFLGTLVVYPLGKTGKRRRATRGALFSF